MNQWAKWRKDLIEPVWAWHSVPYGIVRTIIEAGEAQAARLAELEAWAETAHDKACAMNWILTSERTPPDGQWCWVSDGCEVYGPAIRDSLAAGGWSNSDTWEDFRKVVTMWWPIEEPARPYVLASEDPSHGHCEYGIQGRPDPYRFDDLP